MTNDKNEFTKRLIQKTRIKEDSRVLDLGCGTGAVSILVSNYINNNGEIIGVDNNPEMIKAAKKNIQQPNISFIEADINNLPDLGTFDLIIGRKVLMYQNNDNLINSLSQILNKKGKLVFQENDSNITQTQEEFPVHSKVQKWIWKTLEKEGSNIHIGSQLYSLYKNSDLTIEEVMSEQTILTQETGSDLGWKLKVMKSRMIEHDIINEQYDIEELSEQLEYEINNSRGIFIRNLKYGIIGRKE